MRCCGSRPRRGTATWSSTTRPIGWGSGNPLTAADYGPPCMAEAMLHSDHPLQALLYSVVLHRFLRWRQSGYDPEQHLAGVLYLFLRGMCGERTPVLDGHPSGVFSWRPPPALGGRDVRSARRPAAVMNLLHQKTERPTGLAAGHRGRRAVPRLQPRG